MSIDQLNQSIVNSYYFNNGDVENQVTIFQQTPDQERLVFVPNWKAKKKHWIKFISALNNHYKVEYFESREKMSTVYKGEAMEFTIEQMARDLATFLNQSPEPYHLVGTSIGACSIIKAWDQLKVKPKTLTLICPIINLKMPLYFHLFRYIPENLLSFSAPIVYHLMAGSKRMKHVSNALYKSLKENDVSELKIIRASVQDILKMRMQLEEAERIDCPCMIIHANNDRIHNQKDALSIKNIIPNASGLGFTDFRAVHEKTCAQSIVKWLNTQATLV